jgi:ElaB/YqjD/DUF883 family membrane-anchored ribosome-binding protein
MTSQQEGVGDGIAGANMHSSAAHSTTDKMASRAHEAVDRVAEKSGAAEQQLRDQAHRATERVRDTEERAKAVASESVRTVESYIERNPLMSAGIAFVAGLVLSGLLRR